MKRLCGYTSYTTQEPLYSMDQHPPEHFLSLDPDSHHQWILCQLVVDHTRQYLGRVALLEIAELGPVLGCPTCANNQQNSLKTQLEAYIASLAQQHAGSEARVQIKAAWGDWQARQSAFTGTSVETHPVYFAALEELVKDLKQPPPLPGLEAKDCELARVAILVSWFAVCHCCSVDLLTR